MAVAARTVLVALACSGSLTWADTPALTLGLVFPDTAPVPLDFLNVPVIPPQSFMDPWRLTDPSNRFVSEGGLAGMTEQQVQLEILKGVQDRYYSVATPIGTELKVNFQLGMATGPNTINVALGKYNIESEHWFGLSDYREAFDKPTGKIMAAVDVEELSTLKVTFDTMDKVVTAIANVAAHEIGHMYGLLHVCAGPNCKDCVAGCPVVTNPYDIMATGPSGLPEEGWIAKNVFTDIPGTQKGGLSSVGTLLSGMGVRTIADTDYDSDVDTTDLLQMLEGWTGSTDYGVGGATWSRGDFDHDFDVDSSDILTLLEHWTGALSASSAVSVPAGNGGGVLAATAVVPEPTSGGLLWSGLSTLGLLAARRRHSR